MTDEITDPTPMTYDFRSPQQLNKEQLSRLESLHEIFAQLLSSSLSGTLRMVVDIDVASVDQILYHEFVSSLSVPCSAYSFTIEPHGGSGILNISPELLSAIIDRSFGGQGRGDASTDARTLTPIETSVVGKVVARAYTDLEAAWEPMSAVRCTNVTLETNSEFIQLAASGDSVLVVGLEANAKSATGLLQLCYPRNTLDPLLPKLTPASQTKKTIRQQPQAADKRSLDKTKVAVCIQVARGKLSLNEVADIQVGDVVKLDTPKDDPAIVLIGNKPKFLSQPGLQGKKRAVQILREITDDDEKFQR